MSKTKSNPAVGLTRLLEHPAQIRIGTAERAIMSNLPLIRRAMREGHGLDAIARGLSIPKPTLKRYLNKIGLFFRKPRKKKGTVIRPKKSAIRRAKNAALANV